VKKLYLHTNVHNKPNKQTNVISVFIQSDIEISLLLLITLATKQQLLAETDRPSKGRQQ